VKFNVDERAWLEPSVDARPLGTTIDVYSRFLQPGRDHRAVRVANRYVGNLPPMPGVFPDYPAPVIRIPVPTAS
jgi:hypothetical protein